MMRALTCLAALLVAGCAVGPDFERPEPPKENGYLSKTLGTGTVPTSIPGYGEQHFAPGEEVPAQWWTSFGSPKLDSLVEEGLKNSPTIEAAQAALRQARELSKAQWAAFFPLISGTASQTRAKNSSATIASPVNVPTNPTYSLTTAQLNLAFAPDIFGANRRAVESAEAQAEAARFELEAARLTLASNIVVAAIAEAALRGQIDDTRRMLAIQYDLTEMLRKQRGIGTSSALDLLAQQAIMAQLHATLPPLEKQLSQSHDQLTALLGRPSAREPAEIFTLADFKLPDPLPVSLPSRLVEQRPDIRAAEEALHSATAQVGVSVATMLPQFAIDGTLGSSGTFGDRLFSPGNGLWSIGASFSQTLFDAGALLHKRRAADAAMDLAAANYRQTVIAALQNVADALHAVDADAEALQADAAAADATKASWDLAYRQYGVGAVSLAALLNIEQSYQQAHLALIQAEANRLSDTVGLFQALGGGWWNRSEETAEK